MNESITPEIQPSRFGTNLATALAEAHKSIGAAVKGAANPFFKSKYSTLGDVLAVCKEPLSANGLSILQLVGADTKGAYLETILLHSSGEHITSTMAVTPTKPNDLQALGSAITYCRRYALQSMMCIPSVDDDTEWAEKAARNRPEDATEGSKERDLEAMQSILALHEQNALDATTDAERKKHQMLASDMREKIQEQRNTEKPEAPKKEAKPRAEKPPAQPTEPDDIPAAEVLPPQQVPWPEHKLTCVKSKDYFGRRLDSFTKEEIDALHTSIQKKDMPSASRELKMEAIKIAEAYTHWNSVK